ncbi:MAG: hypothetical protein U5L04_05940 [Trueperaceae bacterium]|nr:hypothetical protein [Trueperaceae bacterium]
MANKRDPHGNKRPDLDSTDIWALILATYQVTLPYLIIFVVLMLFATWLITDVLL